jgi:hypothetical protein
VCDDLCTVRCKEGVGRKGDDGGRASPFKAVAARGSNGGGPGLGSRHAVERMGNDPLSVGTDGRRASARDRGGMGRR